MGEKAKRGRPRTFVAPTTVRFRGDQLEAIDHLAAAQDRDDAYIIRLLVDEALAARASEGRPQASDVAEGRATHGSRP